MHRSLRTFLELLSREKEIVSIDREVDPYLELAEIHRRVIEQGGPALLFKRVKGGRFQLLPICLERRNELTGLWAQAEDFIKQVVRVAESAAAKSI
jgi:UbiD family decarboxylase